MKESSQQPFIQRKFSKMAAVPKLGFQQSLFVWFFRCCVFVAVLGLVITVVHYTPVPDTSTFPDCNRPCHELDWPMICRFKMHVEYFEHFRLCQNVTQCSSEEICNQQESCQQMQDVYLINKKLLGPTIQVCKNDILVIDIVNHVPGRSLSFHWHGQHVRETPSMDGVAMVTQCPVLSHTVHQYKLRAAQAGTHYYHALTGDKVMDISLQGGLIVRESERQEVHSHLYDEDILNHTVHLTQRGHHILVNGHLDETQFRVSSSTRYRFRLIHGGVCPLSLSISSHPILLIAVDVTSTVPVLTDEIEIVAGERLDLIITADQQHGSYEFNIKSSKTEACHATLESKVHFIYEKKMRGETEETQVRTIEDSLMSNKVPLISTLQSVSTADVFTLDQLRSAEVKDNVADQKPDVVLNLEYYKNDFNNISFQFPSSPLLSQLDQVDPLNICRSVETDNTDVRCTQESLCSCIHVVKVPLNAVVQVLLIDKGNTKDNVFHLHGHNFQLLGRHTTYRTGDTRDSTTISDDDRSESLGHGVSKDTIAVNRGEEAVIQFRASNPGFWSLHSQYNLQHQVLFQVGEVSDFPPTPHNFPTCGSYVGPAFLLI